MRNLTVFLTFLPLFMLLGCSKAKSNKWLVADIHIYDKYTGQDVPCSIELRWTTLTMFGSYSEFSNLGATDESGRMTIEREISKKNSGFKIYITPGEPFYGIPPYNMVIRKIDLNVKSANTLEVALESNSYYTLSLKNSNCAGPTDTIFVQSPLNSDVAWTFSGCVDTTLIYNNNYTSFSFDPNLTMIYTVKRGQSVETFQQNFQLLPRQVVPIEIVY